MINEGFEYNQESFPAAEAWNKHYSYENIDLWKAEAWQDNNEDETP